MSNFQIDPMHSEVSFKVKHLMISSVTGHFSKFNAEMKSAEPDFSDADIRFDADIDTISTNNSQRDAHLKSADFFDAEKYPKLSFSSTGFKKLDEQNYGLEGNLDLHGVSKPVVFKVEYAGKM